MRELLQGTGVAYLQKHLNTPQDRVREALQIIWPCTQGDFADASHHREFAAMQAQIAARGPIPGCVDTMKDAECRDLEQQLLALAAKIART